MLDDKLILKIQTHTTKSNSNKKKSVQLKREYFFFIFYDLQSNEFYRV